MSGKTAVLAMFAITLVSARAWGQGNLPPIKELTNAAAKPTIFKQASRDKPLLVRSMKEAGQHFSNAPRFARSVDFKRQFLLVFAWRGSGQDRMTYSILESFPEQIVFSYQPGRTRDLRPHVKVYALRSNVKWRVKGAAPAKPKPVSKEYAKLEILGKLNNQVAAIGGETTGVTVTANGVVFELDLRNYALLENRARLLHGRLVLVNGALEVRRGVERGRRLIVKVDGLRAASAGGGGSPGNPYLTSTGELKQKLELRDAQSGFAGESGHIWTVQTDGSWQRRPFLNRNVRAANAEGKLTVPQIKNLAEQLSQNDLLGLPDRLGKQNAGANPHSVALSFGAKRCAMVLRAGSPVPKPTSPDLNPQEKRFATLVHALQDLLKTEKR